MHNTDLLRPCPQAPAAGHPSGDAVEHTPSQRLLELCKQAAQSVLAGAAVGEEGEAAAPPWGTEDGLQQLQACLEVGEGADVNARDAEGYTALMWAARAGWVEAVGALLAAGADARARAPVSSVFCSAHALAPARMEANASPLPGRILMRRWNLTPGCLIRRTKRRRCTT